MTNAGDQSQPCLSFVVIALASAGLRVLAQSALGVQSLTHHCHLQESQSPCPSWARYQPDWPFLDPQTQLTNLIASLAMDLPTQLLPES